MEMYEVQEASAPTQKVLLYGKGTRKTEGFQLMHYLQFIPTPSGQKKKKPITVAKPHAKITLSKSLMLFILYSISLGFAVKIHMCKSAVRVCLTCSLTAVLTLVR